MKNLTSKIAICFVFASPLFLCDLLRADLIITLSPDGSGGTNLQFDGSGTVMADGALFHESLVGDFYIPTGSESDNSITPSHPMIGGGEILTFFVFDSSATGTTGDVIAFGASWIVGGNLATANGQTFNLDEISFDNLKPGSYVLTRPPGGGGANVGAVTLNIVPEPTAPLALMAGATLFAFVRRKRRR